MCNLSRAMISMFAIVATSSSSSYAVQPPKFIPFAEGRYCKVWMEDAVASKETPFEYSERALQQGKIVPMIVNYRELDEVSPAYECFTTNKQDKHLPYTNKLVVTQWAREYHRYHRPSADDKELFATYHTYFP